MDRRSFLKKAGLATGAAATSALAAPAIAQGGTELRMVMSWPKNSPGVGVPAERFAKRVETASEGRYRIRVFGGGELVHPLKCHDAVQEGTADLYHSAEYYYQGKSKGLAFFTTVPFGFRPDEQDAWIYHGGGQALWDELNGQFGIKALPCGNTGSQMGGWFNKPIQSLEDFKGLKMRIPGLAGGIIEALGGTTVTLAATEILPALQAGTIDATEWVGPWSDLSFGLYKVVKFYHYPGFHEPGATLSLGISRHLWDGLSEADKAIFQSAAMAENNYNLAEYNANNTQALDTLMTKHGVELVEFSDDIYRGLGAAAKDVLASAGAADPMSKKIYESFVDFRKKAVAWSKLSDQSYMNKRELTEF